MIYGNTAKKWSILHIINMGTLMSTLDVGIVNVSLPTIAGQFSSSLAQVQWITTTYLLTMVALLPIIGKLSDIWDRRKIYSYGFLVFSIGSLCITLSQGMVGILFSRCIQGVGATMIMANSQAMVRQVFPDYERGRALGINAMVISLGTLSGPAIGGLLLEFVSWPWLFLINVPIGLAAFLLGRSWFPSSMNRGSNIKLDIAGSSLLASAACLLMFAAEVSRREGGFTPAILMAGLSIALFAVLWLYQRRIAHGILDRELFRHRKILLGNISSFLINMAQAASMIPIIFYLQNELGLSTSVTGGLLILNPLLMGMVSPFAGWFRDKYGGFFPITLGALFCAVSMLFVAFFHQISAFAIILHLSFFGIGMGLFHATNNAEIMSSAPESTISLAGSLLALIRYLGQMSGIGLATVLVGSMGLHNEIGTVMNINMRFLFLICFLCCFGVSLIGWFRRKQILMRDKKTNTVNFPIK